MTIGSHMSIKDGFLAACQKAYEDYEASALMTFLRSPRSTKHTKPFDESEARIVKSYVRGNKLFFVAHGIYLVNFAKKPEGNKWALDIFVDDLRRIEMLGGVGVIVHMGKSLDMDKSEAKANYIRSLKHCLEETKGSSSWIILENTAGQGSEFGFEFEELADIYKQIGDTRRVKFCLDTQHSYAAGYDWNFSVRRVFKKFDEIVGLDKLALLHLNNSKTKLGSHVDRHENLETGLLKIEAIKEILEFVAKKEIPIILETPDKKGGMHEKEIALCKRLVE